MVKTKLLIAIIIIASYGLKAQVAVTSDGSSADASAMFEVKSSNKGVLISRMNQTQIGSIPNPADGLQAYNTDDGKIYVYVSNEKKWKEIQYGDGVIEPLITVTNPVTGETWMDRNLGASRVALCTNDASAYGDLYQWGRATEGHQNRNSQQTINNASTVIPNAGNSWDGLFITEPDSPNDWLTSQDNTLWQGVNGVNNPCPSGFRLPTIAEWDEERATWATNDAAGAFGSCLKLTVGGFHDYNDGSVSSTGSYGHYWSSSAGSTGAWAQNFFSTNTYKKEYGRAHGFSIRCIKE